MASPGSAETMEGLDPIAAGKRMWTSSRHASMSWSCSSMTIWVQSAFVSGQQLRATGKNSSSELFVCHFRSGAGALGRYARDASRTSRTLFACDCLFRFGCTLYLNSWLCAASLKQTRSAFAVSRTVTWNCPVHCASPSMLPSMFSSAVVFSSMSTFTGSRSGFTGAAAAGSAAACAWSGAASGSPSAPSNPSPGFFLASFMPIFIPPLGLMTLAEFSDCDGVQAGVSFSSEMFIVFWKGSGVLLDCVALSPP
mmetsp:Transcript_110242/g.311996  ORF Transcript_110242/g.311996 Transcript_110242/m.311996 type:complete len:253 (+) Transcript_110242:479-1237(+)